MNRRRRRRTMGVGDFLTADLGRYDPLAFPEDLLYRDEVVSILGAPMDGWVPELVYRYAVLVPTGLNVDWAIMLNAYRVEDGGAGPRRQVERVDICHSEIHTHRFRRSGDPNDDLGERTRIMSLYAGNEATVSREWDVEMVIISREWQKRLRRWIDG
jgi:hypothetical protein